jgi:hypothetical protein
MATSKMTNVATAQTMKVFMCRLREAGWAKQRAGAKS